jgi:4-hydroxybenzoate polyprenyltransferase
MIILFFVAHYLVYLNAFKLPIPLANLALLFIGTTLFFFKLRLYDEIKDFEIDLVINPTRPLPRGLLKHRDLFFMIVICIFTELILFYLYSAVALKYLLLAVLYSLLMFKEFFIPKIITPHLTTYALTHTVVTVLLSLSLFGSMSGSTLLGMPANVFYFSLISWLSFNIFEFGRKSFLENEERENVESYSNIFGKTGAFLLTFSQMALILIFLILMTLKNHNSFLIFYIIVLIISLIIGLFYIAKQTNPWGKVYRGLSSGFIIVVYLGFIIQYLI